MSLSNLRPSAASRRTFLKQTSQVAAGAALTAAIAARSYAGEDNTIKIALVGCGGRGTGAAKNALSTQGPTKLVAMADVFDVRLASSLKGLSKEFPKQVDVPAERQFLGMDAYKKAIDVVGPDGVVLLTTPPAFRPLHVGYAVQKGANIFMEKSFGVDAPGIRQIMKLGEEAARKNLKVAGGLMSRHSPALAEAIAQVHAGAIGDVITLYAYREHGPVGYRPKSADVSELAHQIRNYSCFTWLNGTFLLDWLIHNLDVCCWVKNAWPVSCQGQGGRQVRTEPDQQFDHFAVEYTFADGTRLMAQGRHINNCWGFFGDVIHGTKGCAVLGEGINDPKLFKGHLPKTENLIWQYQGPKQNAYQVEHDLFFKAIRENQPYNEAQRCAQATLVGVMGRMAAESGKEITAEQALACNEELCPNIDKLTWDSAPPVKPDASGKYPVAMPGLSRAM